MSYFSPTRLHYWRAEKDLSFKWWLTDDIVCLILGVNAADLEACRKGYSDTGDKRIFNQKPINLKNKLNILRMHYESFAEKKPITSAVALDQVWQYSCYLLAPLRRRLPTLFSHQTPWRSPWLTHSHRHSSLNRFFFAVVTVSSPPKRNVLLFQYGGDETTISPSEPVIERPHFRKRRRFGELSMLGGTTKTRQRLSTDDVSCTLCSSSLLLLIKGADLSCPDADINNAQ